MKKYIALLLLTFHMQLFAQNIGKMYDDAYKAYNNGEYTEAIFLFSTIMERNEKLPHIIEKLADAYRLNLEYDNAITTYTAVIESYPQSCTECYFWLAELEKMKGEKTKAIENYRLFLQLQSQDSLKILKANYEMLYANNEVLKVDSIKLTKNTVSNFIHSYGISKYNSSVIYSGIPLTSDTTTGNSTLYIYPQNNKLEKFINFDNQHVTDFCATQNSDSILFTLRNSSRNDNSATIYYSLYQNSNWSNPKPISPVINLKGCQTIHPYIAIIQSKQILFFSSNRAGGFGGMDIWMSEIIPNKGFSEPQNLGPTINTCGDEICPYYNQTKKVLYFSSDFHTSMGGFDIFSSKYNHNSWEKSKNIGAPINSTFHDLYYKEIDSTVYFVSNREPITMDSSLFYYNNVYSFKINQTLKPQQKNNTINKLPTISKPKFSSSFVTLYFDHNCPTKNSQLSYTEEYNRYLENKKMYLYVTDSIRNTIAYRVKEKNITDYFNNQVIANYVKLDVLMKEIQNATNQSDTLIIQLQAYTSIGGSFEFNEQLATRRIDCVMKYITSRITKEALQYIQFEIVPAKIGNSKVPKDASTFDLQYALERKVEITVQRKRSN